MSLSRSQMLALIEDAASGRISVGESTTGTSLASPTLAKRPSGSAPASVANLAPDDRAMATALANDLGQGHIFEAWPAAGVDEDKKKACLAQCHQLDKSYPGGLGAYVASARKLLGQSQRGENPLDGWMPSVPADGVDVTPGTPEYQKYELAGLAQAGKLGYVVPAGGLGERLGYHGVKFALPSEISTGASVLRVCARTTR